MSTPEAWQPLPPRKNRNRRGGGEGGVSAGADTGAVSVSVSGSTGDKRAPSSSVGSSHTCSGDTSSSSSSSSSGSGDGGSGHTTEASSSVAKKAKTLADNIENRINQKWAHTSAKQGLESKDGVASEFYEYLDHTADVQLHAWGATLELAFSNIIPCMFNYMTDLNTVIIQENKSIEFEVKGHDMDTLLFAYMDEFLFYFSTENFCCKKVEILELDRAQFSIKVKGHGETYDLAKHPQGTEVKAITYSNMQIHENADRADLYVIVDI